MHHLVHFVSAGTLASVAAHCGVDVYTTCLHTWSMQLLAHGCVVCICACAGSDSDGSGRAALGSKAAARAAVAASLDNFSEEFLSWATATGMRSELMPPCYAHKQSLYIFKATACT